METFQFNSNFLDVKDKFSNICKIRYLDWNYRKNNNTIFCVHGITRNCRDFDYLADSLSKDYRVICPDIVGRGESDWLENKSDYNYRTYCKHILYILKHIEISSVDFIGTSMGGIIGIYLAAYYPRMIRSLVLNDIGPHIDLSALKRIGDYISIYPSFSSEENAEIYIKKTFKPLGITKQDHWEHILRYSIKKMLDGTYNLNYDPGIAYNFQEEISKIENMDLWDIWNKIDVPVLILRGKKSDILTEDTLHKMIKSKKNVDFIEFANIGHAPSLMEEDQITFIHDWLSELFV